MKSNTRHTTPVEIIYTYRFDEPKMEKKKPYRENGKE